MERYPIANPIQQLILDYRVEKGISFRDFLEPELRHTALNNLKKGEDKYIQMDTLDKIFNKHPELAARIAKHFYGFLKENNTSVEESTDNNKKPMEKPINNNWKADPSMDELIHSLMDGDSNYILMHKVVILEKYRLVSIEQKEKDKQELLQREKHISELTDIIRQMATGKYSERFKPVEVQEGK